MTTRREFLSISAGALAAQAAGLKAEVLLEELEIDPPMMNPGSKSFRFENSASMEAGLHYRSLADTALGTLEWWQAQPGQRRNNPRGWPGREKERAAIERLRPID